MDDIQRERGNEPTLMKILEKIQKNEAQQMLLETTLNNITLLQSRILSSLQPKIGKHFQYEDLERKRNEKLKEVRKELLQIAVEEKVRNVHKLRLEMGAEKVRLKTLTSNPTQVKEIMRRLETKSESAAKKLNKKRSWSVRLS